MAGKKGRRADAAAADSVEYAPTGTSPGDVQSVQADGTLAYGPPGIGAPGPAGSIMASDGSDWIAAYIVTDAATGDVLVDVVTGDVILIPA